jgi:hypothetical protein
MRSEAGQRDELIRLPAAVLDEPVTQTLLPLIKNQRNARQDYDANYWT